MKYRNHKIDYQYEIDGSKKYRIWEIDGLGYGNDYLVGFAKSIREAKSLINDTLEFDRAD